MIIKVFNFQNVVILSKDCISMPTAIVGLEEPNTKTLRIDDLDGGAVIYSHDFESGVFANASTTLSGQNYYAQYPLDFACEVVVHAPIENGRIMLSIVSFFIPSSDQTCKDDFLYVFDSNTARSKAMVCSEFQSCKFFFFDQKTWDSK